MINKLLILKKIHKYFNIDFYYWLLKNLKNG